MKIAPKHRDIETGGIVTRQDFTVKAGAHIMAVLSGLYKDPIDAMVREYLTNMFDAIAALLRKDPSAEILPSVLTLPTVMSPELVFKDNGIGMSYQTVMDVFSQYGNSLKNDTNLEVGGFGLGSKTAFCYNDGATWTIESRYEGESHIFMASIGEGGIPFLAHVSTANTTEHSGVTIRIPILRTDISACYDAANRYVPYFTLPLTVEGDRQIDGKMEYEIRGDTWGIRKDGFSSRRSSGYYYGSRVEWRVVMGNVPYDVNWNDLKLADSSKSFYHNAFDIFVPIGSVDIVPSRDSLKMTDRTRTAIHTAMKGVIKEIGQMMTDEVASQPTYWAAMESYAKLNKIEGAMEVVSSIKWKGKDIETSRGIIVPFKAITTLDKNAKITQYGVESTERAGIIARELKAGDEMWAKLEHNWIILENQPKGIAKIKSLLFENLVHKSPSGRTLRYGHKIGHAFVLSTKITTKQISDLFGGIPENRILKVSDMVVSRLPAGQKSSVDTIYRWNGSSWDARVNIPGTSKFYLTLDKSDTGRYAWTKIRGYNTVSVTRSLIALGEYLNLDCNVGNLYGIKSDDKAKLDDDWVDLYDRIQEKIIENAKSDLRTWSVYSTVGDYVMIEKRLLMMFTNYGVPTTDPLFAQIHTALVERDKVRHSSIANIYNAETLWTPATKKAVTDLIATQTVANVQKLIKDMSAKYPLLRMIMELLESGYNTDAVLSKNKKLLLDFWMSPR